MSEPDEPKVKITREALIKKFLERVYDWDFKRLVGYARYHLEENLSSMTNEQLEKEAYYTFEDEPVYEIED